MSDACSCSSLGFHTLRSKGCANANVHAKRLRNRQVFSKITHCLITTSIPGSCRLPINSSKAQTRSQYKKKRLTANDLRSAKRWNGDHYGFLNLAVVLRQGRGKLVGPSSDAARTVGFKEYGDVLLGNRADRDFTGQLSVMGARVDWYSIHTPIPVLRRHAGKRVFSLTTPKLQKLPGVSGATAEYSDNEFVEVYTDDRGISSAIWTTTVGALDLFDTVEQFIGRVPENSRGAIQPIGSRIDYSSAADTRKLLGKFPRNENHFEFCRIDYGEYALIWNDEYSDGDLHGIIPRQASLIFSCDDTDKVIAAIESTATISVRGDVQYILPDLLARATM